MRLEKEKERENFTQDGGRFSEEAFQRLMESVEAGELLHAPSHLKDETLARLRRERRREADRQLFVYRAKVLAGMAAAIAVLFFMPADRAAGAELPYDLQREQQEELEEMTARRRMSVEAEWERYLARQERGGPEGFCGKMKERIAFIGASLSGKTDAR